MVNLIPDANRCTPQAKTGPGRSNGETQHPIRERHGIVHRKRNTRPKNNRHNPRRTNFKQWTVMAAGGTAIALAGVVGVGPALAGAQSNNVMRQSSGAVSPDAVPLKPGTYKLFIDGMKAASITFASDNSFTSPIDGGDSGTWVQAGKTWGMVITGGADAAARCIFAGHVDTLGTGISFAGKPGMWTCPGLGSSGTFYVTPRLGPATPAMSGAFTRSGVRPRTAGAIVPATYSWTLDGSVTKRILIASNNTYTSRLNQDDSGAWVQGGSASAFSITGGTDGAGGCLFVGKVNHTGTAVGTVEKPGNWVCPGFASDGNFDIQPLVN
jgi:hypothetical protein